MPELFWDILFKLDKVSFPTFYLNLSERIFVSVFNGEILKCFYFKQVKKKSLENFSSLHNMRTFRLGTIITEQK